MRSLGYEARIFASAEDFCTRLMLTETACLIADVQMPGMSGLELQSRLRAKGTTRRSSSSRPFPRNGRTRAPEGGAVCFLKQAVRRQVLVDCLTKAPEPRPAHADAKPQIGPDIPRAKCRKPKYEIAPTNRIVALNLRRMEGTHPAPYFPRQQTTNDGPRSKGESHADERAAEDHILLTAIAAPTAESRLAAHASRVP